ncbi:hypothetical protein J4Q44_G00285020 [Coregonus suidteri]|uniref:Uncharacterized protein n=1 Tax=Coregonus suidteri TaxID=861788 RepID=A0AAN8L3M0_9TELE
MATFSTTQLSLYTSNPYSNAFPPDPISLSKAQQLKEPSHPRCLQYVKTVVPKGGNRRVRRLIKSRVKRNSQAFGERCKKYRKEVLRKRRIYRDLQEKRDGLIARAAAKVAAQVAAKYPRALSEAEAESDVEGEKKTMPEEAIKGKLKKKLEEFNLKMKRKSTQQTPT